MLVDPFQEEVARIALAVAAPNGFALAGGNALVAHGLTRRHTEDVDVFTIEEQGPATVEKRMVAALVAAGFEVVVERDPAATRGEFARLLVRRGPEETHLDLARDWRQLPPVSLELGPVLALDDAVGSKVTAMVGRALPRDYVDVAAAAARYDQRQLLILGFVRDPGLRPEDIPAAMQRLDALADEAFAGYVEEGGVAGVRAAFASWSREADPTAVEAWSEARRIP